jgi:hypothetical protein
VDLLVSWAQINKDLAPVRRGRSRAWPGREGGCNVGDMGGLAASVVLIAILLGALLVVVFDVFCLLRLGGTADAAHFVPRFAWAILIVGTSPLGGLVYLLTQRLRKRSPEPLTMRPRPLLGSEAGHGPALAKYRHSPSSPVGHGVAVVAISGVVYLVLADKVLDALAVMVVLAIIVVIKSTAPGR